jgi:hypothetical protein
VGHARLPPRQGRLNESTNRQSCFAAKEGRPIGSAMEGSDGIDWITAKKQGRQWSCLNAPSVLPPVRLNPEPIRIR